MPLEEFDAEAKKWIAAATDPRWKRPYTDLTYQPMQEVLHYLRDNGYKTYIATGGGPTSSGSTPIRPMVYRPSRWSARRVEQPTAMTMTANRS